MKAYKLIEDFSVTGGVYHTFKKGLIFFEKKDSLGQIFYPEDGFYPVFGQETLRAFKAKLKRIDDVPYSPDYYIRKNRIKKLRAENREEELKRKP